MHQTYLIILEYIGMFLSLVLALTGIFFQLLTGRLSQNLEKTSIEYNNVFLLNWLAHGVFISFHGVLSFSILFLYGLEYKIVQSVLSLEGVTLVILSLFVICNNFSSYTLLLRFTSILEIFCGTFFLLLTILAPAKLL